MTSIAWFLVRDNDTKREDEALVKKTFHDLRRHHMNELRTNPYSPDLPHADTDDVIEWLEDQKARVRHDPRIKDRLRPTWETKLDNAIASARSGDTPDVPTFRAWQELESTVREKKVGASPAPTSPEEYVERLQQARAIRKEYELALARRGTLNFDEDPASYLGGLRAQLDAVDQSLSDVDIATQRIEVRREARDELVSAIRQGTSTDPASDHVTAGNLHVGVAQAIARHPEMGHLASYAKRAHQVLDVWREEPRIPGIRRRDQWHALEYLAQENDRRLVAHGHVPPKESSRRQQERKRLRSHLSGIKTG